MMTALVVVASHDQLLSGKNIFHRYATTTFAANAQMKTTANVFQYGLICIPPVYLFPALPTLNAIAQCCRTTSLHNTIAAIAVFCKILEQIRRGG